MLDVLKNLFFKNIGIRQTIVKNTFWLVSAEVASRVLGLVVVIYAARILGATEYGKFTFAFSFAAIMAIISDIGLSDISTREFSRGRENEKKLPLVLGLEVLLCFTTAIIAFISSFFIAADPGIRKLLWMMTLFVLGNSFLGVLFAFFRARQNMEYEAVIKFFQAFVSALLALGMLVALPSAASLSYGYLASNIVIVVAAFAYFHFRIQPIQISFHGDMVHLLGMAWPLSFGLMIVWIYICINSVMLGYFGLITENGWYNAASRIAIVAIMPASLIVKSFYPALSSFFVSSRHHLQRSWNYLMELMIFLSLPTVVGGIIFSPRIIHAFYGEAFSPSVLAFQLLIVAAGISFLNYPYAVMLVISDHQKNNFALIMLGAFITTVASVALMPNFGFYGVILATIIASAVVLLCTVLLVYRLSLISLFSAELAKSAIIAMVACCLMYAVVTWPLVAHLPTAILLIMGFFVYVASVAVCYWLVFPGRMAILRQWRNF